MSSMDIAVDRAGYMLCWGCMVWVPSVYTLSTYYIVNNGSTMSETGAILTLLAGAIAIFLNYDCDYQRYVFRSTGGKCKIFRSDPTYVNAVYKDGRGKTRRSMLLTSGWWGVAKHIGYNFEVLSAFLWSLPAGFGNLIVPYFYVAFLAVLLVDRACRDDDKCRKKYGKAWEEYEREVRWKLVPGVF